jgi:hypothetical protein
VCCLQLTIYSDVLMSALHAVMGKKTGKVGIHVTMRYVLLTIVAVDTQ